MNLRFLALFSLVSLSFACSSSAGGGAGGDDSQTPAGGARFFLPTGQPDNTSAPSVEVDAAGNTHSVYPAYAIGGAYYAICERGCQDQADTKVVRFDTDGTTGNAMLALDGAGHPRVLLSAYDTIYYGTCESRCGERASWTLSAIAHHDSEREVTGEAFTLDAQGHPRFLMHTRVAYLGIGQKEPETRLVSCDVDCANESSWTSSRIAQEIWQGSQLRYDTSGTLHVATVVAPKEGGLDADTAAYLTCAGDCTTEAAWNGIGLGAAYQSELEAITMKPSISMDLTHSGGPRVAFVGADEAGQKRILYYACDGDCQEDHWSGILVSDHEGIGPGLDLALDANDKPRLVVTLSYDIGLWSCDASDCTAPDTAWSLLKVEAGADMPPDEIMPYPNCTVGLWFLHGPSLGLTGSGEPRVGYQARDISGGTTNPDPTSADCVAGTDMTFSRLALLPSAR